MAAHGWGTAHSVGDWLFDEGYRFDFYQAVRLLELMYPERDGVGELAEPAREAVRFRSEVSLAFPAGDVAEIRPAEDGRPAEIRVNFLGLAGAFGPLPLAHTELVLERMGKKDGAMRDFLDLFNHRLISLMYRGRRLHRVGLDRGSPEQSHLAPYIFSFIGLETEGLKGRMGVPDRALLYYAGILAGRPRSMAGLECLIAGYFGLPVKGMQMIGRWIQVDRDQRTAIGRTGWNRRLGIDTELGERAWNQQEGAALRIGPVSFTRLLEFLPGGAAFAPLCALIRFYAGEEHDIDLIFPVDAATVPPLRLGGEGRLGWTTWLGGNGGEKCETKISARRIEQEMTAGK